MTHWTNEEIEILKNNYIQCNEEEIRLLLPNRTFISIHIQASRLKITKKSVWTENENKILIENYSKLNIKEIQKLLPNRTISSIRTQCFILNVTKQKRKRCAKLLENNIINANIWGFIFGDGHLAKNGSLQIQLKDTDSKYLEYIANYLDCKIKFGNSNVLTKNGNEKKYCKIKINDKENISKLKEKLQISNQKTYFPPKNLNFINNKEELFAFLIGIIDSDGCITFRKNKTFKSIIITMHANWKSWFELFSIELEKYFDIKLNIKLRKSGKAISAKIGQKKFYIQLKQFITNNNLNHLKRKWH